MRFYIHIILPPGTDVFSEAAVEKAAASLMAPFKMWEETTPVGQQYWDWYVCCTKEWMEESESEYSAYPAIPAESEYVVVPVETLTDENAIYAILTPDGQWHESDAADLDDDDAWLERARLLYSRHPGHYALLTYCHG